MRPRRLQTKDLLLTTLIMLFLGFSLYACKKTTPTPDTKRPAPPQTTPKDRAAPRNAKTTPHVVLFLGDSLTAGYRLARAQAFPALIDQHWRKQNKPWRARNSGVSGDTTAGVLSRLNWVLKPDVHTVFLAIGGNDGLRGFDLNTTKQNLKTIIRRIRARKKRVLMAGIQLPTNYGPTYRKQFKQMYRQVAQTQKVPLMPFLLKDVGGVASLNLPDRIHPNPKGHKIIARNILAFFTQQKLLP